MDDTVMKRIETNAKSAGFTLIELAISVAILLLVSLVIIKFWVNTSEAFTLDGNMVALKQQSERAMEIMAEKIRRATVDLTLVVSNGNATLDFVDNTDPLNAENVQYTLAPLAPAAPIWGQIIQTVNGTQRVVAGYVETLQFTASPTGLVTITATFHKGVGRAETTLTVQTSVSARN